MARPLNKKVFLKKLNSMINDPDNEKYIKWDEDTNAIIIKNKETFSEKVLPKCFNHKNFSSFVRQLNSYGFSKKKGIKTCLIYENKNFKKNMTDKDLESIQAKKPKIKKFKSLSKKDINIEINRNSALDNIEEEVENENDNEIKIKLNSCLDDLKLLLKNQEKLFFDIENLKNEQQKIILKNAEEPQNNKYYLQSSINEYENNDNINNMNVHNSFISLNQLDYNINQEQNKYNNSNLTTSIKINKAFK